MSANEYRGIEEDGWEAAIESYQPLFLALRFVEYRKRNYTHLKELQRKLVHNRGNYSQYGYLSISNNWNSIPRKKAIKRNQTLLASEVRISAGVHQVHQHF